MSNALNWVTFMPNANKYTEYYEVSSLFIDLFGLSYMIIYPFVCFPQSYVIDNVSLKGGVNTLLINLIL